MSEVMARVLEIEVNHFAHDEDADQHPDRAAHEHYIADLVVP
jgi:hypothetical protein